MPEMGEGTAIAVEQEEPKKEEEQISIRFHVFFDGTLNNRTNTDARLLASSDDDLAEDEREAAAELKKEMSEADQKRAIAIYKEFTGKGSYENGHTNIAKMERYMIEAQSYDATYHSYIEGPGTQNEKKDKMRGYALGTGSTGIEEKVKKGILDVINKVTRNNRNKKVLIEKITLDVFGFSRGAAGARNCIYEALYGEAPIKSRLQSGGYKIEKVEVCFAGLYDTVSSHGLLFSNDTSTLKLDAITHAKKVIHLTAAEEHRKNFSLTTIKSARGKGREIFLPGVHSDIGGSYRDGATEKQLIYSGSEFDLHEAEKERAELIAAGWYNEDEITLHNFISPEGGGYTYLAVTRSGIHNQYSRIPLHIMARFARENKLGINPNLERTEDIPSSLSKAKQKIENYVNRGGTSEADDWRYNDAWLCELRHDYFHFSARMTMGNGPRYIKGRRQRMYYDG